MAKRGKFIVLDGGEGAGKSTVAGTIEHSFPSEQVLVTCAGGTALGKQLKQILTSEEGARMTSESRFSLAWATHADHLQSVVIPALTSGVMVVTDRFDSTAFAYQVWGEQAPNLEEIFWKTRKVFLAEYLPDLYILLDVSVENGLQRLKKQGRTLDYFEKRPKEFHRRVREGYQEFFKKVPHTVVDANRPLEAVEKEVLNIIREEM